LARKSSIVLAVVLAIFAASPNLGHAQGRGGGFHGGGFHGGFGFRGGGFGFRGGGWGWGPGWGWGWPVGWWGWGPGWGWVLAGVGGLAGVWARLGLGPWVGLGLTLGRPCSQRYLHFE
jgi:hypothetical protein